MTPDILKMFHIQRYISSKTLRGLIDTFHKIFKVGQQMNAVIGEYMSIYLLKSIIKVLKHFCPCKVLSRNLLMCGFGSKRSHSQYKPIETPLTKKSYKSCISLSLV